MARPLHRTRARAIWQPVDPCTEQDSWTEPGSLDRFQCGSQRVPPSFPVISPAPISPSQCVVGPSDPQGQL